MKSAGIEGLSRTISALYEAAFDASGWPDAIRQLNLLFDGSRACIARSDGGNSTATATVDDPEFSVANPAFLSALTEAAPLLGQWQSEPAGQVFRSLYHLDREGFLATRMWTDYCRERDMYDGLAVNLPAQGCGYLFFDVQRGKGQEKFGDAEIRLMSHLVPHLLRSGEIGRSIEATRETAAAFAHLPFGLLITDKGGKVLRANDAAEAVLCRAGMPLGVKAGRLTPDARKDAVRLEQMIAAVCAEGLDLPDAGDTIMLAPEGDDAPPTRLLVSVAPYADMTLYGLKAERRAAVMLRDLTLQVPEGFDEIARSAFGLTPSELRVAAALASGRSLQQAAAENRITPKSAHTYLARIFRKTGTAQQSQLVALLKTLEPFPRMI